MKKNVVKLFAVIFLAIICATAVSTVVMATSGGGTTRETFNSEQAFNVERFKKNAKDNSGAAKAASNVLGSALIVVQVIGVGVAVIMLVVLAIKYISAAPGDTAEIKKHAVVYVVGAIVLFAASGILSLIRRFAVEIDNTIDD